MTVRPVLLTPLDRQLLRAIEREGSVAAACRRVGISRDRGVYRIARLSGRLPGDAVVPRRGGSGRGSSRLTAAARRLIELPPETVVPTPRPRRGSAVLVGTYRSGEEAYVRVGGRSVYVDFIANPGETVGVVVDPEAIVVAPERFESSARNVWAGRVRSIDVADPRGGRLRRIVQIRALGRDLPVALTPASVRALRLVPGRRVYLYAKATALRRVPITRGSLRR